MSFTAPRERWRLGLMMDSASISPIEAQAVCKRLIELDGHVSTEPSGDPEADRLARLSGLLVPPPTAIAALRDAVISLHRSRDRDAPTKQGYVPARHSRARSAVPGEPLLLGLLHALLRPRKAGSDHSTRSAGILFGGSSGRALEGSVAEASAPGPLLQTTYVTQVVQLVERLFGGDGAGELFEAWSPAPSVERPLSTDGWRVSIASGSPARYGALSAMVDSCGRFTYCTLAGNSPGEVDLVLDRSWDAESFPARRLTLFLSRESSARSAVEVEVFGSTRGGGGSRGRSAWAAASAASEGDSDATVRVYRGKALCGSTMVVCVDLTPTEGSEADQARKRVSRIRLRFGATSASDASVGAGYWRTSIWAVRVDAEGPPGTGGSGGLFAEIGDEGGSEEEGIGMSTAWTSSPLRVVAQDVAVWLSWAATHAADASSRSLAVKTLGLLARRLGSAGIALILCEALSSLPRDQELDAATASACQAVGTHAAALSLDQGAARSEGGGKISSLARELNMDWSSWESAGGACDGVLLGLVAGAESFASQSPSNLRGWLGCPFAVECTGPTFVAISRLMNHWCRDTSVSPADSASRTFAVVRLAAAHTRALHASRVDPMDLVCPEGSLWGDAAQGTRRASAAWAVSRVGERLASIALASDLGTEERWWESPMDEDADGESDAGESGGGGGGGGEGGGGGVRVAREQKHIGRLGKVATLVEKGDALKSWSDGDRLKLSRAAAKVLGALPELWVRVDPVLVTESALAAINGRVKLSEPAQNLSSEWLPAIATTAASTAILLPPPPLDQSAQEYVSSSARTSARAQMQLLLRALVDHARSAALIATSPSSAASSESASVVVGDLLSTYIRKVVAVAVTHSANPALARGGAAIVALADAARIISSTLTNSIPSSFRGSGDEEAKEMEEGGAAVSSISAPLLTLAVDVLSGVCASWRRPEIAEATLPNLLSLSKSATAMLESVRDAGIEERVTKSVIEALIAAGADPTEAGKLRGEEGSIEVTVGKLTAVRDLAAWAASRLACLLISGPAPDPDEIRAHSWLRTAPLSYGPAPNTSASSSRTSDADPGCGMISEVSLGDIVGREWGRSWAGMLPRGVIPARAWVDGDGDEEDDDDDDDDDEGGKGGAEEEKEEEGEESLWEQIDAWEASVSASRSTPPPLPLPLISRLLSKADDSDATLQWLRKFKHLSRTERGQRYRNTNTDRAILISLVAHMPVEAQSYVVEAARKLKHDSGKKTVKQVTKDAPEAISLAIEALDSVRQWLRYAGIAAGPSGDDGASATKARAARVRAMCAIVSSAAREPSGGLASAESRARSRARLGKLSISAPSVASAHDSRFDSASPSPLPTSPEGEVDTTWDGVLAQVVSVSEKFDDGSDIPRAEASWRLALSGALRLMTADDAPSPKVLRAALSARFRRARSRAAGLVALHSLLAHATSGQPSLRLPSTMGLAEAVGSSLRLLAPAFRGVFSFPNPSTQRPDASSAAGGTAGGATAPTPAAATSGGGGGEEGGGAAGGGDGSSSGGGDGGVVSPEEQVMLLAGGAVPPGEEAPAAPSRSASLRVLQVATMVANRSGGGEGGVAAAAAISEAGVDTLADAVNTSMRASGFSPNVAAAHAVMQWCARVARTKPPAAVTGSSHPLSRLDGIASAQASSLHSTFAALYGWITHAVGTWSAELARRKDATSNAIGMSSGGGSVEPRQASGGKGRLSASVSFWEPSAHSEAVPSAVIRGLVGGALSAWALDLRPRDGLLVEDSGLFPTLRALCAVEAAAWRADAASRAFASVQEALVGPSATPSGAKSRKEAAVAASRALGALPPDWWARAALLSGRMPKRDAVLLAASAAPAVLGSEEAAARWLQEKGLVGSLAEVTSRLGVTDAAELLTEIRGAAERVAAPPKEDSPFSHSAHPVPSWAAGARSAMGSSSWDFEGEAGIAARAAAVLDLHTLAVLTSRAPEYSSLDAEGATLLRGCAVGSLVSEAAALVPMLWDDPTSAARAMTGARMPPSTAVAALEPVELEARALAVFRIATIAARSRAAAATLAVRPLLSALTRAILPPHPDSIWCRTGPGADLSTFSPRLVRLVVRALAEVAGALDVAPAADAMTQAYRDAGLSDGAGGLDGMDLPDDDSSDDEEGKVEGGKEEKPAWDIKALMGGLEETPSVRPVIRMLLGQAGSALCGASVGNDVTCEFGPGKARQAWACEALDAVCELSHASPTWRHEVWSELAGALHKVCPAVWDIVAGDETAAARLNLPGVVSSLRSAGLTPPDVFRAVAAASTVAGPEQVLRVGGVVRVLPGESTPGGALGVVLATGRTLFGELMAANAASNGSGFDSTHVSPELLGPGVGRVMVLVAGEGAAVDDEGGGGGGGDGGGGGGGGGGSGGGRVRGSSTASSADPTTATALARMCIVVPVDRVIPTAALRDIDPGAAASVGVARSWSQRAIADPLGAGLGSSAGGSDGSDLPTSTVPGLGTPSSLSRMASAPVGTEDDGGTLPERVLVTCVGAAQLPPPAVTAGSKSLKELAAPAWLQPVSWLTALRLHALRALPVLAKQSKTGPVLIRTMLAEGDSGSREDDTVSDPLERAFDRAMSSSSGPIGSRPIAGSRADPWRHIPTPERELRRPSRRLLLAPLARAALRPLLKPSLFSRGALMERRRTLQRWSLELAQSEVATGLLSPHRTTSHAMVSSDEDGVGSGGGESGGGSAGGEQLHAAVLSAARAVASLTGKSLSRVLAGWNVDGTGSGSGRGEEGDSDESRIVASSSRDEQVVEAVNVAAATGKPDRIALAAVEMLPSAGEAVEWLLNGSDARWAHKIDELARLDDPTVGEWVRGAASRIGGPSGGGGGGGGGEGGTAPLPAGSEQRPGPTIASMVEEAAFKDGLSPQAAFEATTGGDDDEEDGEGGGGSAGASSSSSSSSSSSASRGSKSTKGESALSEVYAGVLQTAGVRFSQVAVPEPRSGGRATVLTGSDLVRDTDKPGESVPHGLWRGAAVTIAAGLGGSAGLHHHLIAGETTVPAEGASLGRIEEVRTEAGFAHASVSFWDEDSGVRILCHVRYAPSSDGGGGGGGGGGGWGRSGSGGAAAASSMSLRSKGHVWSRSTGSAGGGGGSGSGSGGESVDLLELPLFRPRVIGGAVATGAAGLGLAALVTDDALCTLLARDTLLELLQRFSEASEVGALSATDAITTSSSTSTSSSTAAGRTADKAAAAVPMLPLPTNDLVRLFRLVAAAEIHKGDNAEAAASGERGGSLADGPPALRTESSGATALPFSAQSSVGALLDAAVGGEAWAFDADASGGGGPTGGSGGGGRESGGGGADGTDQILHGHVARMLASIMRRQLVAEAEKLRRGTAASELPLTRALVDEVVRNVVGGPREGTAARGVREKADERSALVLQSLHPLPDNVYYTSEVCFLGASSVRIEFDRRTTLPTPEEATARITVDAVMGEGATSSVRVLEGRTPTLTPVVVAADRVRIQVMHFPSGGDVSDAWGFRMRVIPQKQLRWQSEEQVVSGAASFEFGIFLLRFLAAAAPELVASGALHSARVINALIRHLFTPARPYKRRVLNLLAQLLSTPQLLPGGGGAAGDVSLEEPARHPLHFSIIAENLYTECERRLAALRAASATRVDPGLLRLLELSVLGRRAAYHLSAVGRSSGGLRSVPMSAARYDAGHHSQSRLPAWPPDDSPTKMLSWTMGLCAAVRNRWPLPELFLCTAYCMAENRPHVGPGMPRGLRVTAAQLIRAQKLLMSWTHAEDEELMRWLHAVARRVDKSESRLEYSDWGEVPDADRRSFPRLTRHMDAMRPRMQSLRLRCAIVVLLNQLFRVVLPYVDTEVLGMHGASDAGPDEVAAPSVGGSGGGSGSGSAGGGGEAGGGEGSAGSTVTRWTPDSESPPPSELFTPEAAALATLGRKGDAWSLSSQLGSVSHLMFEDCKQPHVDAALSRTQSSGGDRHSGNVRLHNGLALRSMNNGWTDPGRSECLFAQLANIMVSWPDAAFRAPLDGNGKLFSVKFLTFDARGGTIEEEGIDAGGLYRAAMSQTVTDCFTPSALRLLIPAPAPSEALAGAGTFIPNPVHSSGVALRQFELLGILIGIAVRTKRPQAFQLPALVWKRLLGQTPTLNDLRQVDESFANHIARVRSIARAVEGPLDTPVPEGRRAVSLSGYRRSDNVNVPLPRQTAALLTSETAMESGPTKAALFRYCREALAFRVQTESESAYVAMRRGLGRVVPPDAVGLLTWRELETMAAGEKDVDVERLKRHAQYVRTSFDLPHGQYNEHHPVIQRLWRVLESFTNEERVLFLEFVWGRSRLPPIGSWPAATKFKIGPLARSDQRRLGDRSLPLAHTCFFQIELPAYSSERVMREKILVAAHGSVGVIALA